MTIYSQLSPQQAGNPYKSKRVEGMFSGDLADVEQEQGGYEWYVVGKTTKISGSFSVICSLR